MTTRNVFVSGGVVVAWMATPATAQLYHAANVGGDDGGFGAALANVGDLNSDGCDELAAGEPNAVIFGYADSGRVLVIDGATGVILLTCEGSRAGWFSGSAIAGVGDWGSDGVPDFVSGAPGADDSLAGLTDCGSLYLWSGATGNNVRIKSGLASSEAVGSALAGIEDYDGDGYGDLLVGVPATGEARLYDETLTVLLTLTGDAADSFGEAVARLGDLDGDGVDDFAVAEPGYDSLLPFKLDRGRVLLYSGASTAQLGSVTGLEAGDRFGSTIARLGDLDGDGVDDFAVGAAAADPGGSSDAGQVRVFSGATRATLFTLDGAAAGDDFGTALCGTADLDHDGVPDFAVGAPDGGSSDIGTVEVRSGADAHVLWTIDGSNHFFAMNESLGQALAGGDWNGDGVGDVAAGDPLHSWRDATTWLLHDTGQVQQWLGCPAWSANYGNGLAGRNGVPSLVAVNDPAFGTTLDVSAANSSGVATLALLLSGTAPTSIPYTGGTLLATSDLMSLFFTLPAGGILFSEDVPDDPTLAFLGVYVQVIQVDAAAVKGVSMSPGLELRIGYDLP